MRHQFFFSASIAALMLMISGCESFQLNPPTQNQVELDAETLVSGNEIIAIVNSVDSAILLERKAKRLGYNLVRKETLVGLDFVMLNFLPPKGLGVAAASLELEKLEPHATAGVNHRYTLQGNHHNALDIAIPEQLPTSKMNTPRLYADAMINWPSEGCRAFVPIGMIDGAVNRKVAGLAHADIVTADFSTTSPGAIDHGTAIAEILVGQGRLNKTRLYSASVISETPQDNATGVAPIVRAINWMTVSGVKVVNISLAGPYNKILDRAIQRATKRGVTFVAAVGNTGPGSPPRYPAALKEVIAVTAVDSLGSIYKDAVTGQHVDVAAPGVDVYVKADGKGRYVSGTSIATPYITSYVAGAIPLDKVGSPEILRTLLSRNTIDLGVTGHDPVFGAGLVHNDKKCQ